MLHAEKQDEEFQEADILLPDAAQDLKLPQVYCHSCDEFSGEHGAMRLKIGQRASSPIDIPGRKGAKGGKGQPGRLGGGSVMIGSHVFVPPHVIVDRRAKREKAMMLFVVPSGRKARKTHVQQY